MRDIFLFLAANALSHPRLSLILLRKNNSSYQDLHCKRFTFSDFCLVYLILSMACGGGVKKQLPSLLFEDALLEASDFFLTESKKTSTRKYSIFGRPSKFTSFLQPI